MAFNLEDYEDVNSRVSRFQKAHPVGRIQVDVVSHDVINGLVLVRAACYREYEDINPSGVDYAFGQRDLYPASLRKFYVEDTCTSAIGRCLALVLPTENKPTKQDMERVEGSDKYEKRLENFKKEKVAVENPKDPWTIETKEMPLPVAEAVVALNDGIVPEQIPMCPKHNRAMQSRTGNKNGKPWKHYKCIGEWPDTCDQIIWMEIDKSGRWVPQRPRPAQGVIN